MKRKDKPHLRYARNQWTCTLNPTPYHSFLGFGDTPGAAYYDLRKSLVLSYPIAPFAAVRCLTI